MGNRLEVAEKAVDFELRPGLTAVNASLAGFLGMLYYYFALGAFTLRILTSTRSVYNESLKVNFQR